MQSRIVLVFAMVFTIVPSAIFAASAVGSFDAVNNTTCTIAGWAKDPDSTSGVSVGIFRDGPYGSGTLVGYTIANLLRTDLPFTDKSHGFSYVLDLNSGLHDGLDHLIYTYGFNASGTVSALLNLNPKTIHCPLPPVGLPLVNVRDYGAKGDGIADDAPAIKRAIAALSSTGGTITIPAGTYMLGTSAGTVLNFPNGNGIENAILINKPNVIFKGEGSSTIFMLMPHVKMRILAVTASNVTVDSVVGDGNKSNRDSATGWPSGDVVDGLMIGTTPANHITFQNCEVRNGIEDGIGFWKVNTALVQNCYSHDNGTVQAGGTGISFSGGDGAKGINNRLEGNSIGVWAAYGGHDITLQNNTIKDNLNSAITMGGFTGFFGSGDNRGYTIIGNTITGNGRGGFDTIAIESAKDGVIRDNVITDNAFDSITILSEIGTNPVGEPINPPSTNWTITNNNCSNTTNSVSQKWGMRILGYSSGIVLRGNTCLHNGTTLADQIVVATTSSVNADWQTANTLSEVTILPVLSSVLPNPAIVLPQSGGGGGPPPVSLPPVVVTPPIIPPVVVVPSSIPPSPSEISCPALSKTLARGSRGRDVFTLQTFFISINLLQSDSATGYFGLRTQIAVQNWQRTRNIVSSGTSYSMGYGVVGKKTRKSLKQCAL